MELLFLSSNAVMVVGRRAADFQLSRSYSATSTTTDMNLKQKVNTVQTHTTLTSPPLLIRQSLVHCFTTSTK